MTQIVSPKTTSFKRELRIPGKWGASIAIAVLFVMVYVLHLEPNKSFHPLEDACEAIGLSRLEADGQPAFPDVCASIERHGEVQLAFVEFDDQGEYFDQRQSFAALRLIRESLRPPNTAVEVFVFVHGWQHSANPVDEHVSQFKTFLLSRAVQCKSEEGCKARKTLGIYIGWPGKTLRFPLNILTFWSRKAAAHRVASGSIQEFFATLQQLKDDNERYHLPGLVKGENFRTYIIGHSFGGLIAYQANSQSLALRYGGAVLDSRGSPTSTKVGDLLILINPAIEALRFSALHSLWSEYSNDPFYSPNTVVVGSRTDWATRILFPAGVAVGTLATNQIRSEQWDDALTTVGNSDAYLTHNAFMQSDGRVQICERPHDFSMRKAPFWFISANPNLIDGHGDLNATRLLKLFASVDEHVSAQTVGGLRRCKDDEE